MRHKDCEGIVIEDWDRIYEYKREDGKVEQHPSLICLKCGQEIIGDEQLELEEKELEKFK